MRSNADEFASLTWAVIIGVGRFRSAQLAPLQSPARDALALVAALTDEKGSAIPLDQVKGNLIDEHANKSDVLATLMSVVSQVPPQGVLIIYFAGHGVQHDNHFYLCTFDTNTDDLLKTAISDTELDAVLQDSSAQGVLMILDCCRSAGFADHAPGFFRRLGSGAFRILMSASRAEEPSWELPATSGTIFTHHLLRVITGEVEISSTRGLIYFSELLVYIQNQVAEDLEKYYANAPKQEPVFAGVYSRDPLLFVHKRLTLRQISIQTTRYSRAYIRRLVSRILIGILVLLLFISGVFYSALDNYEYVAAEADGRFSIYRGYPGWNVLGFPKKKWTLDIRAEAADPSSALRQNLPLVSGLGKPVLPLLHQHLRPEFEALLLHWEGKDVEARAKLKALFTTGGSLSPETFGAAVGLFSELADEQDLALLLKFAQDNRRDVQKMALRGLARVAPNSALEIARTPPLADQKQMQEEIISALSGECSPANKSYVAEVLSAKRFWRVEPPIQPYVLEAAVRLKCQIPTENILHTVLGSSTQTASEIGNDVASTNHEQAKLALRQKLREIASDSFQADRVLHALAAIPGVGCDATLWSHLNRGEAESRAAAAAILLENCREEFTLRLREQGFRDALMADPDLLTALAKYDLFPPKAVIDVLAEQTDGYSIPEAAAAMRYADAAPILWELIRHWRLNFELKRQAVVALSRLHSPADNAPQLFTDESLDVQREAYKWYRRQEPSKAFESLLKRFDEQSIDYLPEVLGTTHLEKVEAERLRLLLSGSANERRHAATILAMQSTPEEVMSLLTSKEVEVRQAAALYAVYNRGIEQIAQSLRFREGYPDWSIEAIQNDWRRRAAIEEELRQMPERFRAWRARLYLNTHPSLSPGLKLLLGEHAGQ